MSADETDEGPLGPEVSVESDSSSLLYDEVSPEVVTSVLVALRERYIVSARLSA
jgi:hypothetical protein